MAAESAKTRFDRALVELQVGLKVLPIGVAEAGAWRYAFVYEIVQRHYPDLPQKARGIKRSEARRDLVRQYVDNVIAVDQGMIRKVFHVLSWTPTELGRTIQALTDEGATRWMRIKGEEQPQLVSLRALESIQT